MSIHDKADDARRKVYDDALAELESKISGLTNQVVTLTNEASNLRTQLTTTTSERDRALTDIEGFKAQIAECATEIEELTAIRAQLETRIRELEAATPTAPVKQPSEGLSFFADSAELAKSDKKWLDHYFPVFGLQMENVKPSTTDTYGKWLTRDGEGGKFAVTGGRLRDRPLSEAPYTVPSGSTWFRQAAAQEIRDAKKYLRDGFFVNLMTSGESHARFYNALRDEANANFPGFLVVPMVDVNGSLAGYQSGASLEAQSAILASADLVRIVGSFLTTKNAWTLSDGSVVVGSYKANGRTQAWWADLAAKLKTATGKTVSFVHVYNNSPSSADVSGRKAYASGAWSIGSDPGVIKNSGSSAAYKSAGRLLMGVQPQNIRPGTAYGPWFDEAANTEALRAGIAKAISDGAQVVQGVTWSDLTEGGHYVPSAMRGTAALEISAMGIYEWKTGKKPEILKDHVVLSHRNQTLDAQINPAQQTLMVQNASRGNRVPVRNKVEVLTYLTKADKVTVTVGGTSTTYDAPAGEFAYLVDVKPGKVSVKTGRGITLESPVEIRSVTGNQDRQYAMSSNFGPTDKQYDPTPKG